MALLEEIPKKIKIVVNPNAGGGKGRKIFPLLRQKLLDRGVSFHLQFAESADHVALLCRQALGEGYNYIISCGGDGTHHQALKALVGSRFILGFIPAGTGNDFPTNLGIPEDLDSACDLLLKGKVRKIDVIQVNDGEYMAGVGGIGFDSEVNAIANRISRFVGGRAAYVLPVLIKTLTYRPKEETALWKSPERDPISRFGRRLEAEFGFAESELEEIRQHARAVIDEALQFAIDSPDPEVAALWEDVYA